MNPLTLYYERSPYRKISEIRFSITIDCYNITAYQTTCFFSAIQFAAAKVADEIQIDPRSTSAAARSPLLCHHPMPRDICPAKCKQEAAVALKVGQFLYTIA
jgi:hypothetical protein